MPRQRRRSAWFPRPADVRSIIVTRWLVFAVLVFCLVGIVWLAISTTQRVRQQLHSTVPTPHAAGWPR